ncbi:hypothetical protein ABPG75_003256 [Micractinium tetrahymenae]
MTAKVHHFTRWLLDDCSDPAETLARLFPGKSAPEASHMIESMSPRSLRELFRSVFGGQTTSNNTSWMRGKLKTALGLAGKKARPAGAAGRKRAHPYNGGTASRGARSGSTPAAPLPALYPTAAAHGYYRASPDPFPEGLLGQAGPGQWAGGAGGSSAAASGSPRAFHRYPSSDGDAATSWGPYPDDRAFEAGAATLLAAAAEVDSASAAEAEAAVDAALAVGAAAAAPAGAAMLGTEGCGESAASVLAAVSAMPSAAPSASPLAPATPTQAGCQPAPPAGGVPSAADAAPTVAVPGWALALGRSPLACQLVTASQQLMLRALAAALSQGASLAGRQGGGAAAP